MTYSDLINSMNEQRILKEISLPKLASIIGVHRQTSEAWMKMERAIPADYLLQIIHVLDMDIEIVERKKK